MTFLHFIRRTHLYMGLFLLPWMIMFGVSTIPINHTFSPNPVTWTQVAEREFDATVPAAGENLRPIGREMMNAAGVQGGYFVNRANPRQVNVNHPNFLTPVRIIYYADRSRITVEHRNFSARQFITSMHTRGGYDMGGVWDSVCRHGLRGAAAVECDRHLHVVALAGHAGMGMAGARVRRHLLRHHCRDALRLDGRIPCTAYNCFPSPDVMRSMSSVPRTYSTNSGDAVFVSRTR